MTATTTNLGLVTYLTGDTAEVFLDFREAIAGNSHPSPGTGSNLWLIDDAYGAMDGRITTLESASPVYFADATGAGTNYTATIASFPDPLTTGTVILLKLSASNTGAANININSGGAKDLKKVNAAGTSVALASGNLNINRYYIFRYDGTDWIWVASTSGETIHVSPGTNGNFVKIDANGNLADSTYTNTSFAASSHASQHVGADSIQDATASQKGLMTSAYATKLDGISTGADVTASALGAAINGATADTAINDTDKFPFYDGALKSILWSAFKTVLNALYAQLSALNTFSGGASGATGGGIQLSKGTGTGLTGTPKIDHFFDTVDRIRFWESGGGTKGAYIDLTNASASAASKIAICNSTKYETQHIVSPMTTIPAGATRYLSLGNNTFYTLEADARFQNWITGNVSYLSLRTRSAQPGDGSVTVTFETSTGTDLGTITLPAGSVTNTLVSGTFNNAIALGLHRIKVVNNSASTSCTLQSITVGINSLIQ